MPNKKIKLRLGRIGDARKNFEIRYKAIREIAFCDCPENVLNSWGRLHLRSQRKPRLFKAGSL